VGFVRRFRRGQNEFERAIRLVEQFDGYPEVSTDVVKGAEPVVGWHLRDGEHFIGYILPDGWKVKARQVL